MVLNASDSLDGNDLIFDLIYYDFDLDKVVFSPFLTCLDSFGQILWIMDPNLRWAQNS